MLGVGALRPLSFRMFKGGAPLLAGFSLAAGILAKVCKRTRRVTAFRGVKARLGTNGLVEVEPATETFQQIGSLARSTRWGCVRSRLGGAVDPVAVTPHADHQTEFHFAEKGNVSVDAAGYADDLMFQLSTDGHFRPGKSRRGLVMVMRRTLKWCFASQTADGHFLCEPDDFRDEASRFGPRRKGRAIVCIGSISSKYVASCGQKPPLCVIGSPR